MHETAQWGKPPLAHSQRTLHCTAHATQPIHTHNTTQHNSTHNTQATHKPHAAHTCTHLHCSAMPPNDLQLSHCAVACCPSPRCALLCHAHCACRSVFHSVWHGQQAQAHMPAAAHPQRSRGSARARAALAAAAVRGRGGEGRRGEERRGERRAQSAERREQRADSRAQSAESSGRIGRRTSPLTSRRVLTRSPLAVRCGTVAD